MDTGTHGVRRAHGDDDLRSHRSLEDLEPDYFTEHSAYLDVTIQDLEGDDLDLSMHYQDLGEETDPVVVLIHGAFSSSHTFLPWAETLVNNGYRVILPDLPYFGLSGGFEDNVTSYRRSAAVLWELLESLSITEIDIAGNSLGGAVSWFFASEHPAMVRSITMIDGVYPGPDPEEGEGGRNALRDLMEVPILRSIVPTLTPRFLVRSLLGSAYGNEINLDRDTLDRYYDLLRKDGTRQAILSVVQEAEPEWSYEDRLASLTMPMYIMWGELDSWIPVATVDLFQETLSIPDDHIVIYPELGHVPMEEDPETTVADYLDFLSSEE
jgi:pimeloyl-ACP methyl ester carboxylesterase